jgi:flagellar assembly protein FliH
MQPKADPQEEKTSVSLRFAFKDFEQDPPAVVQPEVPRDIPSQPVQYDTPPPGSANENTQEIFKELPPLFSQEELTKAFEEGKAAGIQEGKATALDESAKVTDQLNKKIAISLDSLNIQLATLLEALEKKNPAHYVTFVHQLALGIAKKIMGNGMKEETIKEIEALVNSCMELVFDQPKLTIYLHPELEEPLSGRIQELIVKNNFRGEVLIKADPTLSETDCRIDWQEGFVELSKEELWHTVQKVLAVC